MSYCVPGRFSVFPLWWGGSIWRAMKKKGRVRSGGRAIVVRATIRITTGRIVARATGGQARIDGRPTRGPDIKRGASRQEKNFDRTARAAPARRTRVRRDVPLVHYRLAEFSQGHRSFRRAAIG